MQQEVDIINFQINRKFKNFGRIILEKLEENHKYIKALELVLIKMGINEEKYANSEFQFIKDRKVVLDNLNNSIRELEEFIKNFEINLKKR